MNNIFSLCAMAYNKGIQSDCSFAATADARRYIAKQASEFSLTLAEV